MQNDTIIEILLLNYIEKKLKKFSIFKILFFIKKINYEWSKLELTQTHMRFI